MAKQDFGQIWPNLEGHIWPFSPSTRPNVAQLLPRPKFFLWAQRICFSRGDSITRGKEHEISHATADPTTNIKDALTSLIMSASR